MLFQINALLPNSVGVGLLLWFIPVALSLEFITRKHDIKCVNLVGLFLFGYVLIVFILMSDLDLCM